MTFQTGSGGITIDITFIDPQGMTKGLNAGLAYLAGVLRQKGRSVRVMWDLNNRSDSIRERLRSIASPVAGVSLKSTTVGMARDVFAALEASPTVKHRIAGGAHITVDGENFMRAYGFEAAFIGEGELSVPRYLDHLEGSLDISDVGCLWVKEPDGPRRYGSCPGSIDDLDSLAVPDYTVFDSYGGKIESYPLVISRGCPYDCIYCCVNKVSGRKWRFRHVEGIIEELRRARAEHGSTRFEIIDDNFTLNMTRAKRFCEALIDSGLNFKWSCPNGLRADKLDLELLKLMKSSGCYSINLGIESGVPRVFDRLRKGEEMSAVANATRLAKEAGLKVNGFFIIGIPGSTYEDDLESLRFSRELDLDDALFNLISIYPGTELWEEVNNNPDIRILRHWTDTSHFGDAKPVFETKDYSAEQLTGMFYRANLMRNHYLIVVGETGNIIARGLRLLRIIWKYDRGSLFRHAWFILNNLDKVR